MRLFTSARLSDASGSQIEFFVSLNLGFRVRSEEINKIDLINIFGTSATVVSIDRLMLIF